MSGWPTELHSQEDFGPKYHDEQVLTCGLIPGSLIGEGVWIVNLVRFCVIPLDRIRYGVAAPNYTERYPSPAPRTEPNSSLGSGSNRSGTEFCGETIAHMVMAHYPFNGCLGMGTMSKQPANSVAGGLRRPRISCDRRRERAHLDGRERIQLVDAQSSGEPLLGGLCEQRETVEIVARAHRFGRDQSQWRQRLRVYLIKDNAAHRSPAGVQR